LEVDILAARAPAVQDVKPIAGLGILSYLDALTFNFTFEGKEVSPVLIYAAPDPDRPGYFIPIRAEETGYEGVACVDDTARAAVLALGVYEQTRNPRALRLAGKWLSFVQYMQYPDGDFVNFVRNENGRRNASGPTSVKGGVWWTGRALWALARAYRITGSKRYLEAYERCSKPEAGDSKIHALLALGESEIFAKDGQSYRSELLDRAHFIVSSGPDYFRDHPDDDLVHMWGYHQLHAVTRISRLLEVKSLLKDCRRTINNLLEPNVAGCLFYDIGPTLRGRKLSSPITLHGEKAGLCAYCVSPTVQGLAEMYRATEAERYRRMAVQAGAWFYGRNDASGAIYDPATGLCADGIDGLTVSPNRGAESSIEAGLAELERIDLMG
jgi:hypothetical protein